MALVLAVERVQIELTGNRPEKMADSPFFFESGGYEKHTNAEFG